MNIREYYIHPLTLEEVLNPEDKRTPPDKLDISINQLKDLISNFKDRITSNHWTDADIEDFRAKIGPKIGSKTMEFLSKIGSFSIGDFEVPNANGLLELTEKWMSTVAKDNEKDTFFVIEADGDDFTLLNAKDEIYVYENESKSTKSYHEDIITHLAKHLMAKIVGKEYEY